MKQRPKAISLFAGAGGCSLGFNQVGYDIVYANDSDRAAMESYRTNFPSTTTECEDISKIDFTNVLKNIQLDVGETDIVIGGPPCQGFSTAGPRFWDDPRNHLLKDYVRALETIRPKWFLMENVEGLLTSNQGIYVTEAIKAFVNLGYAVRLEKVYAHEFGIPQRRKRVIILGNLLGIDFVFPERTTHSHGRIFRNGSVTIQDALSGLPIPLTQNIPLPYRDDSSVWADPLRSASGFVTDHFTPQVDRTQQKRIAALRPGETMKDLPESLQHPSFKRRAFRRVKDGTPTEKRGGAPSGLKRLHLNEPSLTITSAAIREFVHPIEDRCLTIRECARIQTFPDDFVFCGSSNQRIQQIGNAIPPYLAKIFAEHIKTYGFEKEADIQDGALIGFTLSMSDGQSPALQHTEVLLSGLTGSPQPSLFEHAY